MTLMKTTNIRSYLGHCLTCWYVYDFTSMFMLPECPNQMYVRLKHFWCSRPKNHIYSLFSNKVGKVHSAICWPHQKQHFFFHLNKINWQR